MIILKTLKKNNNVMKIDVYDQKQREVATKDKLDDEFRIYAKVIECNICKRNNTVLGDFKYSCSL